MLKCYPQVTHRAFPVRSATVSATCSPISELRPAATAPVPLQCTSSCEQRRNRKKIVKNNGLFQYFIASKSTASSSTRVLTARVEFCASSRRLSVFYFLNSFLVYVVTIFLRNLQIVLFIYLLLLSIFIPITVLLCLLSRN